MSTPPGVTRKQMGGVAWEWKDAGKGVIIYVMDGGCDTRHPEFKSTTFAGWIYTGSMPLEEPGDEGELFVTSKKTIRTRHHGTPVIAKAVGQKTGVAHAAEVVVVKLQEGRDALYRTIDGLAKIFDYNIGSKFPGKCVINISSNLFPEKYRNKLIIESAQYRPFMLMEELFIRLISTGCYIVTAAGNNRNNARIQSYPALFNLNSDSIIRSGRLVVVGGSDRDGENVFQKDNRYVWLSAPAEELTLARGYPTTDSPVYGSLGDTWTFGSGTSYAAPAVAGLLAIFISQGYPHAVQQLHKVSKNPVGPNDLRQAFNGILPSQWPTEWRESRLGDKKE
ncbi:hypothetical protein AA313_de0203844 [Arthrobotrys entomopaga]|nr:hypothetical protein AA313_de0203844 [Arthrobotrys entomopaga]